MRGRFFALFQWFVGQEYYPAAEAFGLAADGFFMRGDEGRYKQAAVGSCVEPDLPVFFPLLC